MSERTMRIGAINWDASLPSSTYFGGYTLKNLGNDAHRTRLPFFTKEKQGKFEISYRTQAEYDKELMYAIEGGIDFFAFCWYPDGDTSERTVWHDNEMYNDLLQHYPELNYARKLYQSSKLNSRIGMCAIMFSFNAYSPYDIDELIKAMQQDYYEKVDGRPLVLIFGGYQADFIRIIKQQAKEVGLVPYIAFIDNGGRGNKTVDYSEADAVTAYACCAEAENFDQLTAYCNKNNVDRLGYKKAVIPMLSMGWNPTPRIDSPSPWVSYPEATYADKPNEEEIKTAFRTVDEFIKNNKQANTDCVIVFAWNEFEEGGYLCPTLNPDGTVDDSFIKRFYEVRKNYR